MPRKEPHTPETKARISAAKLGQFRAGRDEDDRVLAMLALRDAGVSSREIGQQYGLSASAVRARISRVETEFAASEAL